MTPSSLAQSRYAAALARQSAAAFAGSNLLSKGEFIKELKIKN
jgi:hypothetical protein